MKRIWALIQKHYDILAYLLFGVLTTVVNYLVYIPCHNLLHLPASVSNGIAWVAAVAFAYLTNKPFVFRNHDWSVKTVLPELGKFVACRVGSGALETAILFVTVDCLCWSGNVMKVITSILVIIVNYVASKLLVFKRNAK